jgi:hypothetical protein
MMIDYKFEQLMNDTMKMDLKNKTDKHTCSVLKFPNVFLGYSGTPGTNQTYSFLETAMLLRILYCVWLAKISGAVQYEDAPRTGTMELHSGKDYHCECLCSRGE